MSLPSHRRKWVLAAVLTLGAASGAAIAGPASATTGPSTHQPEILKGGLVQARGTAAIDQLIGKSTGPAKPSKGGGGGGSTIPQNGINYHGGPVITGTKDVYLIWYGDWSGNTVASSNPQAQSLIDSFVSSIGGSTYFNINTTYMDGSKNLVSNSVQHVASATDLGSQGTALSDAGVQAVVESAISSGRLPVDSNGVYFVLTSGDVSETSGFLTKYCGWHTHTTVNGTTVQYSFVGDPAANVSACSVQSPGPNGSGVGNADAMVSVIAHELEESATDPQLNAWYDRRGYENADKCAWTFGTTYSANGAKANMKLGSNQYLVQQNWVNASGGYCGLSY